MGKVAITNTGEFCTKSKVLGEGGSQYGMSPKPCQLLISCNSITAVTSLNSKEKEISQASPSLGIFKEVLNSAVQYLKQPSEENRNNNKLLNSKPRV